MKKIWKLVIAVMLVLVILLGMLYVIDTNRMKQNKPVLFSAWGKKYKEPIEDENKDNSYLSDREVTSNQSFYGIVLESKEGNIIVEPREGELIRKSADKISINLGKDSDVIYPLGTNVKVTYTGYIMETYPAQVVATDIELKSAENFEIKFYDKHPYRDIKVTKVLDKSEMKQYDYNIYSYDGAVNIIIDGKEMSLRNALLENKITMNEIIAKANRDFPNATIYKDGGSMEYHYKNYTIIKCHTESGNRDVYIGGAELNINDLSL